MRLTLLILLLCYFLPVSGMAADKETIVAVVNKGVITASDLRDRTHLIATSSGFKPSPELAQQMRPQMLDMLIDEQIRQQEAKRQGITVTDKEIDDGFAKLAAQNKLTPDAFKKALKKERVNINTLRDQIKTQIAWSKVIQKKIRPTVNVTQSDIDNELARLVRKAGKEQYKIADIYLPIMDPRRRNDALNFATKLVEQLRKQPNMFDKAAKQFSQSPSAQGNGLGWIGLGRLPAEVDAVLPTLDIGKIADPIQTRAGIFIIKLDDKRPMKAEYLPDRNAILEQIGTERMDRAQRRYYLDLRSQTFIEKRG